MIREVKVFRTKYTGWPTKEDIELCIDMAKKDDIFIKLEFVYEFYISDRAYKCNGDYILIDKDSKLKDFEKIYKRSDNEC